MSHSCTKPHDTIDVVEETARMGQYLTDIIRICNSPEIIAKSNEWHNRKIEEDKAKLDTANKQIEELKTKLDDANKQIEELKTKLDDAYAHIEERKNMLHMRIRQLCEAREEIAKLKTK